MEQAYYKSLNDILQGYDRCTPKKIVRLRSNQIFVFGTDSKGSQKHGAAGLAAKSFGVKVGVVDGPTGMCYALPTLGFTEQDLTHAVERFEQYVRTNMKYTYLVTAVGCGHAGFEVTKVANMFKGLLRLRIVILTEAFLKVYRKECNDYFKNKDKEKIAFSTEELTETESVLEFYNEQVHGLVKHLMKNNLPFNKEGGGSVIDNNGFIIAEAELGIPSEMIVFYPDDMNSKIIFTDNGYSVLTPEKNLSNF